MTARPSVSAARDAGLVAHHLGRAGGRDDVDAVGFGGALLQRLPQPPVLEHDAERIVLAAVVPPPWDRR